jgi:hypothetical protein
LIAVHAPSSIAAIAVLKLRKAFAIARGGRLDRAVSQADTQSIRSVSGATDHRHERWLVRMRKWAHPQDLAALLVGIYAALSPIWTTTAGKATGTMIALGVVTAAVALLSLARPDMIASEGLIALMGVLFIISPWVMGFSDTRPMAWTAWIVGVVALLAGAADVQMTRTVHRAGGVVANH